MRGKKAKQVRKQARAIQQQAILDGAKHWPERQYSFKEFWRKWTEIITNEDGTSTEKEHKYRVYTAKLVPECARALHKWCKKRAKK